MNTHEIAKKLLSIPAAEITASVDMSTCDEDYGNRIFGIDLHDMVATEEGKVITLCFSSNDKNYNA